MPSINYLNSTNNIQTIAEQIDRSNIYKITFGAGNKGSITCAGVTTKVPYYYIRFPKELSKEEINYILSYDLNNLISHACLYIEYIGKIAELEIRLESIKLDKMKKEIRDDELKSISSTYDCHMENINQVGELVSPYKWELAILYDSMEIDDINITVPRQQRAFVLQLI